MTEYTAEQRQLLAECRQLWGEMQMAIAHKHLVLAQLRASVTPEQYQQLIESGEFADD